MTTLPSLICKYRVNCLLYYQNINEQTLSYLCLVKLLAIHLPVKQDLTIEEILDGYDTNTMPLSYPLVDRLARRLNIIHLPVLFESMILIYNKQLGTHLSKWINIFRGLGITQGCQNCGKLLLIPSDYYYYICEHCNIKQNGRYYYNNNVCDNCHQSTTNYIIIDQYNVKFKLNCTSLSDNYALQHSIYYKKGYYCSQKCIQILDSNNFNKLVFNIYQKYNQLYNGDHFSK